MQVVRRWMIIMLAAGLLFVLVACGGGSAANNNAANDGSSGQPGTEPTLPLLPTLQNPPTSTPRSPSDDASNPDAPPVTPSDITGHELIAFDLGEQVYSGFACTIAEVGCSCQEPVTQRATFTVVSENTMRYTFFGGGYGSEWLMDRVAPNEWSYEILMVNDQGGFEGVYFVLLTFREDGFIRTEGANLDEGGMVACPDVYFHRIERPAATP